MFPKQATRQVAQGLLKVSAMRDKTKMKANLTKGLLVFAYLGLANAVSLESRQDLAIDTTSTDGTLDIAEEGGSTIIPCTTCGTCPTCTLGCADPCTSMQDCLSISGCSNPCELPTLTPYDFQECVTLGDSCVESTHADDFCLCGTHQEGFADSAKFTESISEGQAQVQSRLKTCGCGHINKTFKICGSIDVCEDITKCICDGKNGGQNSGSYSLTETRECGDGTTCCPIDCCAP